MNKQTKTQRLRKFQDLFSLMGPIKGFYYLLNQRLKMSDFPSLVVAVLSVWSFIFIISIHFGHSGSRSPDAIFGLGIVFRG